MAIGLTGVIIGVVGIVIFSPGCYGVYWTGKRAFERRNKFGVQEFDSYGKAAGATALESIISIVSARVGRNSLRIAPYENLIFRRITLR